jgi:hypothetical protein
MRIKPQKKKIFVFFHHLSFLIPKVVRFLTLPPFKCVFEPSPPFECAFEPSPSSSAPLSLHFLSSAPSSPHLLLCAPSSPRPFFWVRLRALTFFFSAPSSPHLLRVRLRALDHLFECAFEPLPPSSAPLSPGPFVWVHLWALTSFWVRLQALIFFSSAPFSPPSRGQCIFEPYHVIPVRLSFST